MSEQDGAEGHTYRIPVSLLDEWSREGREMEESYEAAQRLLEILREIDEKCAFCPMCMSHKISTVGEKIHKDKCKLEEELGK